MFSKVRHVIIVTDSLCVPDDRTIVLVADNIRVAVIERKGNI